MAPVNRPMLAGVLSALVAGEGRLGAPWLRYALAIACVGAALGVEWALWPAGSRVPFVTVYPAVLASALLLGPGPGLLATVLSAAGVAAFVLRPSGSFAASVSYTIPFASFLCGSALTCFLADKMRGFALALRENEELFRELGSQSRDIIWIVGLHPLRMLYISPALERIWGLTSTQLYQDPLAWEPLVHPDDQRRIHAAWAEATTSGATAGFEAEYRIVRRDGSIRWLSDILVPVRNAAGAVVRLAGVSRDITDHKQVEEALSNSEARYRSIFENANTGIASTDATGQVINFNEAFRSMIGYDAETLMKKNFADFTHPDDLRLEGIYFNEILERKRDHYRMEKRYIANDGRILWVDLSSSAIRDADGRTQRFVAVIEDITERKLLERAVLEAADRERRRLGADLHDGLGQELTGVSLIAGALAHAAGKGEAAGPGELAELELLVRHAINTCRTIAHGLSPLSFADGGLVGALQEMARGRDGRSYGPEIHFAATEAAPLRLPRDAADHLYRIGQEAVTNALRHAEAERIDIRLDIQPSMVRLEIEDDGIGSPPATAGAGGMGQQIMRFRTALIGARLSIGPGAEGGTLVAVDCPQPP